MALLTNDLLYGAIASSGSYSKYSILSATLNYIIDEKPYQLPSMVLGQSIRSVPYIFEALEAPTNHSMLPILEYFRDCIWEGYIPDESEDYINEELSYYNTYWADIENLISSLRRNARGKP